MPRIPLVHRWMDFFHRWKIFPPVDGLAFALLLLAAAARADARAIESFAPASAASWKPFMHSPKAVPGDGGIVFPAPFSGKADRAAWDKPVALDLSAAVAFELDVVCPLPDAVRTFSLYFKSGNGWYAASRPLVHPGKQTLLFSKSSFSAEGAPAGWHRIDGIRVSPWKGALDRDTSLLLLRLSAVEGSLLLVRGTSSCPDAGARSVAAKTTEFASQLLLGAGIGHNVVADEDLAKGALDNARAALLPYNPNPTPAQLKALTGFLSRGGKLGVFYCADAGLASAMGFKLGPYSKANRPDRWRSIVFDDPTAWLVPPRIWQNSPNLMPAYPASAGARTVAFWENALRLRQPEPAIAVSPRGFWMSHVLMGDDVESKKELLVSLCAHLDPSLWEPAARRAAQTSGQFNDYSGISQALAEIRRQLPEAARPEETRAMLNHAEALSIPIAAALSSGSHRDALALARRQRRMLIHADASVQAPRPGEFFGVWDHDGIGLVPGDWNATASFLASHGVNAVFPNLVWGGCAHYPSRHLPSSNTLRLYGDQVAASLAAAKAHSMQMHVWFVLWKLDGAPDDFVARMKKEGRLQISESGAVRSWLSPHHPENRKLALDVLEEIARNYPGIDGIHLDYVRLPDASSCYSPTTRARFEAATGRKCPSWPAETKPGGPRHEEFRRWRTADVSSFVAEARARLRAVSPRTKLSAAVWGITAPDGRSIGQYWPDWLKSGSVDFLVPMNYTESNAEFASWLRTQMAFPGASGKIIPGIGVTADESRLDPAQAIRQIVLSRKAGCPGFVLFALSGTLRDETLPALRRGIARPPP